MMTNDHLSGGRHLVHTFPEKLPEQSRREVSEEIDSTCALHRRDGSDHTSERENFCSALPLPPRVQLYSGLYNCTGSVHSSFLRPVIR